MLLIRLALRGGTLVCFARFCDTFRDVLARGQRAAEEPKERTGLAFVVSHPCLRNKGTARMGHPANAKTRTGLAFVVSHPCLRNKGTARMGHPANAKERTGLAFVVSHPCLRNKGTARMGHPA